MRIKYVYVFLTVLLLCSCSANKKNTQPPAGHDGDTLLILSETARETTPKNVTDGNDNADQYSFKFSNGTHYDMNDLTYFLADTSIKSLRLYDGAFSDLSPLAELTELEELGILSNYNITDISPIGSLVNLRKLTLHNEGYKGSIEALSSLANLKYLQLVYNDRYYRELLPLRQLEELILSNGIFTVLDATYIAQLSSLKKLVYTGSGDPGIVNIERLKNLINLEELYITPNDNLDLSWIKNLQSLRVFSVSVCAIDDISPLLELPNLVRVDFYHARVEDITPLLESTSIKRVNIEYPINEMDSDEMYRLFGERGIEFTLFVGDR